MQNLLSLISLIQLNTVHIARDKHVTVLIKNQPKSKIEGSIKFKTEDFSQNATSKESNQLWIDFSLAHLLNYNSKDVQTLHKWEFSSKFTTFKNSSDNEVEVAVIRKVKDGEQWKVRITYLLQTFFQLDNIFDSLMKFFHGLNFCDAKTMITSKCDQRF